MGMRPYVVKQGDYLTRLAHELGFQTGDAWEHPKNEELRGRREQEDILAPGDLIHIPEREKPELSIKPETVNRYRGRMPKIPLNLMLMDNGKPLADAKCTIEGLGPSTPEGRTNADGHIDLDVPLHVREVRLVFPARGLTFSVLVGHMDPITEPSGVRARLANLGYGDLDGAFENRWDDLRLVDAIRTFQHDEHLEATGKMDDATRDALRRMYGT